MNEPAPGSGAAPAANGAPSSDRAPPLVYLITDRTATGGRPLTQVVAAAIAGARDAGAPLERLAVQLREKDLAAGRLLELARSLRALTQPAKVRLFVNDRVDVALAAGADGVHLATTSLPAADVQAIAPALAIAVSTHSAADVRRARDARVSFCVTGPVFDTPSKRHYGVPLGLGGLKDVVQAAGDLPVLALGGVGAANAASCRQTGVSGVAVIRAVMSASDPAGATAQVFKMILAT